MIPFKKDNKKYYFCKEDNRIYDFKKNSIKSELEEKLLLFFNEKIKREVEEKEEIFEKNPIFLIKNYLLLKRNEISDSTSEELFSFNKKSRHENDRKYLERIIQSNLDLSWKKSKINIIVKKEKEEKFKKSLKNKKLSFERISNLKYKILAPDYLLEEGFLLKELSFYEK